MYRTTKRQKEIFKRMRDAKEAKRLNSDAPDYPAILPELRRTIIIIDHDFNKEHRIDLYKTNRIDCFKAVINGETWKKKIGFSGVLAGIRKALPRVSVSL